MDEYAMMERFANTKPSKRSTDEMLDDAQMQLGAIGLTPVVGEVADAVDGMISLARGDYCGAGLSATSMIPYFGTAAGITKISRKLSKISGKLDWSIIKKKPGETRQAHVRLHNMDNPIKKSHGVFFDDGVAVTNEAWDKATQSGLHRYNDGGLDFVEVPMGRQVGWLGGIEGSEAAVPAINVRIYLESGTNRLITAYPF